jgi:hypothetical protein
MGFGDNYLHLFIINLKNLKLWQVLTKLSSSEIWAKTLM